MKISRNLEIFTTFLIEGRGNFEKINASKISQFYQVVEMPQSFYNLLRSSKYQKKINAFKFLQFILVGVRQNLDKNIFQNFTILSGRVVFVKLRKTFKRINSIFQIFTIFPGRRSYKAREYSNFHYLFMSKVKKTSIKSMLSIFFFKFSHLSQVEAH